MNFHSTIAVSLVACCLSAPLSGADDYYVATNGSDTNPGTFQEPFRTIQKAANEVTAGSTVYIREGTYHEAVIISGKNGTASQPITFTNYLDEQVLLDGTEPISDLGSTGWTQHSGIIYKTVLNKDIWQLFADDEMVIPARWPNADPNIDFWQQWESDHWGQGRAERNSSPPVDTNGTLYDKPHNGIDLAASGIDLTGAIVVLNLGSFRTGTSTVLSHTPGSNMFTFDPITTGFKDKEHYYYAETKLELLDTENEWFYDVSTKTLYLWAPGGGVPAQEIRGKTITYAITATESDYVIIDGFNFRGATFKLDRCFRSEVRNCDLMYPSCTKRMLRVIGEPQTSLVNGGGGSTLSECVVYNCTFAYTDGHGIYTKGKANRVENCYFHHIDYSAANLPSIMAATYMSGDDNVFRHNTIHTFGASVAYSPGDRGVVEYNNLYDGGYKQHDGALIQVMVNQQFNARIGWNWVHDWPRLGARFDGSGGVGGWVHHTVGWDLNSTVYIGNHDNNRIFNNTGIFSKARNEIVVESGGGANTNTITRNNIARRMGGTNSGNDPVPGTADHNWNGYETGLDVRTQLRDPDNFDFRPKPASDLVDGGLHYAGITDGYVGSAPDIGAYEFNDPTYWIPGHRSAGSSMPVPGNAGSQVKPSASLMWLPGLDAITSQVYLGTSADTVGNATPSSPEFVGSYENSATMDLGYVNNVHSPNGLFPGTYYWRVDTVTTNGTIKGEVWSFTTEADTTDANANAIFDWWELEHFHSLSAPEGAPGDDPDGDSFTNQQEFIANTNPNEGNSFFSTAGYMVEAGSQSISFQSHPGRSYSINQSATLNAGSWSTVPGWGSITGTGELIEVTIPAASGSKFYRINAQITP